MAEEDSGRENSYTDSGRNEKEES
ncbi:unnamed protein product [Victoria cruziana]